MPRRLLRFLLGLVVLISLVPMLTPHPARAAGTADLAVSVTTDAKVLKYGRTITYAITVTNLGPDTATGVWVGLGTSDSLAGFGGPCPDGTTSNMCDLGSLAPGASVTVLFRAMATNACCPENVGVAVADVWHDTETIDPNASNDSVRIETKLVGKVR